MTALGLDPGGSVSVIWRTPGLHQVLALHGDEVWFWSFASPEPLWAGVAGTFRTAATRAERTALAALSAAADDASGAPSVLVTTEGRTARVAAGSSTGREVGAVVTPLRDRLRVAPVSAVELGAGVVSPPGVAPLLGLTFTAIGTEPVVVGLDATGVRLGGPGAPWAQVAPPRMGLVGADGGLLDGLYAPATVPAGQRGAWVLPGVEVGAAREVRIGGTVRVAGPVPPGAVAFEMTAPLIQPH